MNLYRVIKETNGFKYFYGVNSRPDFFRAGINIFTDIQNRVYCIKYISSNFGIVSVDNKNEIIESYAWESEQDIENISYLSKHFSTAIIKENCRLAASEVENVINDCIVLIEDKELYHFIRTNRSDLNDIIFPNFKYEIAREISIINKSNSTYEEEKIKSLNIKIRLNIRKNFHKYLNILLCILIGVLIYSALSKPKEKITYVKNGTIEDAHRFVRIGRVNDAINIYHYLLMKYPDNCQNSIELVNYMYNTQTPFSYSYNWINSNKYTFNPAMHMALAYFDYRNGFVEKALGKVDQISDIKSMKSCSIHIKANSLMYKNREEAINLFKSIINADKNYIYAYNNLALMYLFSGNKKEGNYFLEEALKIDPENYLVHFLKGQYLNSINDTEGAKEAFNATIKYNPSHVMALKEIDILNKKNINNGR